MSDNKEKTETIDELYGSVQDIHNYVEIYYYQQVKDIAAVTAIAMLRDNVPPADVKTCINDWYKVEISDHAMAYLKSEAADDEADEALTGNRRSILCPSVRRDRCHCARKAKRLCECGVSPDTIYYAFPELSEEEIGNICSSTNNSNGTRVDDLTLRLLFLGLQGTLHLIFVSRYHLIYPEIPSHFSCKCIIILFHLIS